MDLLGTMPDLDATNSHWLLYVGLWFKMVTVQRMWQIDPRIKAVRKVLGFVIFINDSLTSIQAHSVVWGCFPIAMLAVAILSYHSRYGLSSWYIMGGISSDFR